MRNLKKLVVAILLMSLMFSSNVFALSSIENQSIGYASSFTKKSIMDDKIKKLGKYINMDSIDIHDEDIFEIDLQQNSDIRTLSGDKPTLVTRTYVFVNENGEIMRNSMNNVLWCDVDIYIGRDAAYHNVFDVNYNMTSNSLINGIYAKNFIVQSSSGLFPKEYMNKEWNHGFSATKYYWGSLGRVVISENKMPSKVRVKTKGLKHYYMSHGWVSAINVNGIKELP